MKIAYLDCFSGISGDMAIAAFLDAGLSLEKLSSGLKKLNIKGYKLKTAKARRGELTGTKFDCIVDDKSHSHRTLKEILSIIEKSALNEKVKATAKDIFNKIGNAESKIHGFKSERDVCFHELGDVDSIIDIVGMAIAIDSLGIDEVCSSDITMGRAIVKTKCGNLPTPAPAALELLKGVPVKISDIEAELVTPTGAGMLKSLSKSFGKMPQMNISSIGYGAGSRNLEKIPNMLRVIIGETEESPFKEDKISVIETNIDDMNPQNFEYLFEKLMKEGALDVYTTSINMKKSRPALKLTVITNQSDLQRISSIIFSETTSIGVRFYGADRFKLERKFTEVKTRFGKVKVKLSSGPGGIHTASPEYEECVKIARDKKIPLKDIYEEAKRLAAIFFLLIASYMLLITDTNADTLYTNDGKEVKGIVVEDYRDRIVMSTVDGEITLMKTDIRELRFDSEEDNLIKLAGQAMDNRDYNRAYTYYDMAFKINPLSKTAKDGLVFLQGYLYRKEEAKKEDAVMRQEEFERYGSTIPNEVSEKEELKTFDEKLRESIGITLNIEDGLPEVANIQVGSPASDIGMRKGDRVIAVWGRLTGYMTLKEVMGILLEKPSLELKCDIERTVSINVNPGVWTNTNNLIGASFSMEFDGLTVSGVKEYGAAIAAGLKKSDLITAIDGKSTRYMPLKNAIDLIKNSQGGSIKLTLRREVLIWRRS